MINVKHLFGKDNRISVGDTVFTDYKGQQYKGVVNAIKPKENQYTITIDLRFLKETVVVVRPRHRITLMANTTVIGDSSNDYVHNDMM